MRRRVQGVRRKEKNECFLSFLLSLCLEPYALSREIEERPKATPLELAKSRLCGEMMP
jgi:hypothetical protein